MFGKKRKIREAKQRERQEREAAYYRWEREGAELFARLHELRKIDRERVPGVAVALVRDARHQVRLISQSIIDRTDYRFNFNEPPNEGDIATCLAENIADIMRENVTNPQTTFEALSDQLPEVHFTVDWYDAVSMAAAYLRQERINGVIEGLELAGVKMPK